MVEKRVWKVLRVGTASGGFCCHYCDSALTLRRVTFDHVVPRSRWERRCGQGGWRNLVLACARCNVAKGSSMPTCQCSWCVAAVDFWRQHPQGGLALDGCRSGAGVVGSRPKSAACLDAAAEGSDDAAGGSVAGPRAPEGRAAALCPPRGRLATSAVAASVGA